MDQKLSNLRRLAGSDPAAKERYIRALERIVGLGDRLADEGKLKCVGCVNCADEGYGLYVMTQPNTPGQAPYTWDNAVGPLFICGPCWVRLETGKQHR
jgi:hypothetical protein